MDRLATRVIEIRPDGVEDFRGSYADFLRRNEVDHLDVEAAAAAARKERRSKKKKKKSDKQRAEGGAKRATPAAAGGKKRKKKRGRQAR